MAFQQFYAKCSLSKVAQNMNFLLPSNEKVRYDPQLPHILHIFQQNTGNTNQKISISTIVEHKLPKNIHFLAVFFQANQLELDQALINQQNEKKYAQLFHRFQRCLVATVLDKVYISLQQTKKLQFSYRSPTHLHYQKSRDIQYSYSKQFQCHLQEVKHRLFQTEKVVLKVYLLREWRNIMNSSFYYYFYQTQSQGYFFQYH